MELPCREEESNKEPSHRDRDRYGIPFLKVIGLVGGRGAGQLPAST